MEQVFYCSTRGFYPDTFCSSSESSRHTLLPSLHLSCSGSSRSAGPLYHRLFPLLDPFRPWVLSAHWSFRPYDPLPPPLPIYSPKFLCLMDFPTALITPFLVLPFPSPSSPDPPAPFLLTSCHPSQAPNAPSSWSSRSMPFVILLSFCSWWNGRETVHHQPFRIYLTWRCSRCCNLESRQEGYHRARWITSY